MKRILLLIFCIFSIIAVAQTQYEPIGFKSTSAMQYSGSSLVSDPTLNSDGTAVYKYASAPVVRTASNPGTPGDDPEHWQPIGDVPVALFMGFVAVYLFYKKSNKR